MSTENEETKKDFDIFMEDTRMKRKGFISEYKEKIREVKIEKIKNSILGK